MAQTKLEQLAAAQAVVEKLKAEAAGEIEENKKAVMSEVLAALVEHDITLSQLTSHARVAASKYSDAAGNTWSGKGKQPAWVVKALASGKKLEDLVTPKAAAAT